MRHGLSGSDRFSPQIENPTAFVWPLILYNGDIFPQRPLILFLCLVVIFETFVVLGLSLPLLVRVPGFKPGSSANQEAKELQLYIVNSTPDFIEERETLLGNS